MISIHTYNYSIYRWRFSIQPMGRFWSECQLLTLTKVRIQTSFESAGIEFLHLQIGRGSEIYGVELVEHAHLYPSSNFPMPFLQLK